MESIIRTHLNKYTNRNWLSATWNMIITLIPYFICIYSNSYFSIPLLALLYIRMFFIFHDLGHKSFFPDHNFDVLFDNIIGTFIKISYSNWVKDHTTHHATIDDLTFNIQQSASITEQEYKNRNIFFRILYKIVYYKYIFLLIVPIIYTYIVQRIVATIYENLLFVGYYYLLFNLLGQKILLIDFVAVFIAGIFEFLILHSQHTFKDAYRQTKDNAWNKFDACMKGTSILKVPKWLRFFTYNIQYHHIHHLDAIVSGYNLKKCHKEGEEYFRQVKRLTFSEMFKDLDFTLYDDINKMFI